MSIQEVFAKDGPLAAATGPKYEVREGQVQMAEAIERVFKSGGVLFVEAPTGTGKSCAYLVPAILRAPGDKTVVVTANIALQEQLISKDLPMLASALGSTFKFALAKGISNYLCRDRWKDAIAESLVDGIGDDREWEMLQEWATSTVDGDLSELPTELPARVRLKITTSSDECIGKKCEFYGECHAMAARRRVQQADVVVTNYHLFFADMVIRAMSESTSGILPTYSLVVLDEAHQAQDIGRDFFGWRMTLGSIRWAIRMLPEKEREKILVVADGFFDRIAVGEDGENRTNLRITRPGELCAAPLAAAMTEAARLLGIREDAELVPADKDKIGKCKDRAAVLAGQLDMLDALMSSDANVYYAEPPENPKGTWAVGMKPIEVAEILEKSLFPTDTFKLPHIRSVVATSATLATDKTDTKFDYITSALGAYEASTLTVPSPFDHHGAAVLVVPRDLPDPNNSLFAERVAEIVEDTIRAARGRTLALFTSYRVLQSTYQHLLKARLPYRILRQGDVPRTKLIAQFREDVSSVLLGTSSFWEGIDVPGEALSAVVIDKLPFERPDDPVVEAIRDKYPRTWFPHYLLPRSVIAFRQGFGRLIRTRTDRGAIVVCDRRLVDKPYRFRYIRSLPEGVELKRDLEVVAKMLGGTACKR